MYVEFEHSLMVLEGVIDELAPHTHSCILHYHIKCLSFLLEASCQVSGDASHCLILGHVHWKDFCFVWMGAGGFDSLELLSVARREDDVGSVLVELVGHVFADT